MNKNNLLLDKHKQKNESGLEKLNQIKSRLSRSIKGVHDYVNMTIECLYIIEKEKLFWYDKCKSMKAFIFKNKYREKWVKNKPFRGDLMCCGGEVLANYWKKRLPKNERNKIKITGIPKFDTYLKGKILSRKEFCKILNLNPKKKIIFFPSYKNIGIEQTHTFKDINKIRKPSELSFFVEVKILNKVDRRDLKKDTLEVLYELVKQIGAAPASGSVIKAEGNKVWINIGSSDVSVGDTLTVLAKGEELIDPDTGINAVLNGQDPTQWNVSFVGLINRLTLEAGVPYFLAPGNHDVTGAPNLDSPRRLRGLGNYLSAVANLIPPDGAMRRLDGYPSYALGYGNTFVLALDSNIADDSTQFAWATAQLEGLDRDRYAHVVAFFHHPAYSSGPHGGARVERPTAAVRARWMPLFRERGVDLLFTGHEHLFEHWIERYVDSSGRARRIDQIVTGGGGAPLYQYRGEPDLRTYLAEAAEDSVRVTHLVRPGPERGDNPYHYVVVHVDGPEVWIEVIGVDWGRDFQPYQSSRTSLSDAVRGR